MASGMTDVAPASTSSADATVTVQRLRMVSSTNSTGPSKETPGRTDTVASRSRARTAEAESAFGAGPFTLSDLLGWAYLMGHSDERGPLGGDLIRSLTITRKLQPAVSGLPIGRSIEQALGGRSAWLHEWLAHPDRSDPFWTPLIPRPAAQNCVVDLVLCEAQ